MEQMGLDYEEHSRDLHRPGAERDFSRSIEYLVVDGKRTSISPFDT